MQVVAAISHQLKYQVQAAAIDDTIGSEAAILRTVVSRCSAQWYVVIRSPKPTFAEGPDTRPLSGIDCFEMLSQVGKSWEQSIAT